MHRIINLYFNWLLDFVCNSTTKRNHSKLLRHLFDREFYWLIEMDSNIAYHGLELRDRYMDEENQDGLIDILDSPCSVLEALVALSIKREELMGLVELGDRTGEWFWEMLDSLGLKDMENGVYDEAETDRIIDIFLNREYEKHGRGGIFAIPTCRKDMRKAEIWKQMCWYLEYIS